MYNNFKYLLETLMANYDVSQGMVPIGTNYPYIVYSFVSKDNKILSGRTKYHSKLYQISLFTDNDEEDLDKLTDILDKAGILYEAFLSQSAEENDDTITNFYTYVRCRDGK